MKTTFGTIFVTSCSHFLRHVIFFFFFFFFLIFQNSSMVGDVIQQIKIKKPNLIIFLSCLYTNGNSEATLSKTLPFLLKEENKKGVIAYLQISINGVFTALTLQTHHRPFHQKWWKLKMTDRLHCRLKDGPKLTVLVVIIQSFVDLRKNPTAECHYWNLKGGHAATTVFSRLYPRTINCIMDVFDSHLNCLLKLYKKGL